MTKVKFFANVITMGDKEIVIIPIRFRKDTKIFKGKQVRIQIDDEI